jgi:hypothetical protein
LWPSDDSFNPEAFPNLKESIGFCPTDDSFNPEALSNLTVSTGFCPDGAASQ